MHALSKHKSKVTTQKCMLYVADLFICSWCIKQLLRNHVCVHKNALCVYLMHYNNYNIIFFT